MRTDSFTVRFPIPVSDERCLCTNPVSLRLGIIHVCETCGGGLWPAVLLPDPQRISDPKKDPAAGEPDIGKGYPSLRSVFDYLRGQSRRASTDPLRRHAVMDALTIVQAIEGERPWMPDLW
jgi:hypothetical protein